MFRRGQVGVLGDQAGRFFAGHRQQLSVGELGHPQFGQSALPDAEEVWAETGLVLADEFREENMPASKDIRRMVDEAYAAVPPEEWKLIQGFRL